MELACADVRTERIHRTYLSGLPGVARLRSSFALRKVCDRTDYQLAYGSFSRRTWRRPTTADPWWPGRSG